MGAAVVGREAELAVVSAWLDVVPAGATTLLVEGEAGIGKTALLRAGVAAARERGWRVLVTYPAEAEASLSFAGLGDLLDGVVAEAVEVLPAPQREALEVALLRRVVGAAPDPRTVGAATLGCLRGLAGAGPVLVAVDDVQWVDAATAATLAFAVRRLGVEPVGLLLARRAAPGGAPPLGVDGAPHQGGLRRLAVGPLDIGGVSGLLGRHLGWVPPRLTLLRLFEVSAGNPLFALELGRALQGQPEPAPGEPLPVPERLRDLVLARLHGIAPAHRGVLLAAAALRRPTVELLRAGAGGGGSVVEALEAAEAAGLVSRHGDVVVFAHPLFASVLYGSVPGARRRALHRLLADVVRDEEERARHLALASTNADETVAAALEDASQRAQGRGAPVAAAELAELARRLTPRDQRAAGWRRELLAAQNHTDAHQVDAARRLLDAVARSDAPAEVRADALWLLGRLDVRLEGIHAGVSWLQEALELLGEGETPRRARTLATLANYYFHGRFHNDIAVASAEEAVLLTQRLGDPLAEASARMFLLMARLGGGHGFDRAQLTQGPDLNSHGTPADLLPWHAPSLFWRGALLMYTADHAGARAWLEPLHRRLVELGDEFDLSVAGYFWAEVEWRDGNWEASRALADEALQVAIAGGQRATAPLAAVFLAMEAAATGRIDRARRLLDEWSPVAEAANFMTVSALCGWARGFVELCAGCTEAVVAALELTWALTEEFGLIEQAVVPFRADLVEALIATGDLDRADEILAIVESRRSAFPAFAEVCWLRCRALLGTARGDLDGAVGAGEAAVARLDALPMPFEVARTWLVYGTVLRRARRKRAAGEALERAAGEFRRLGATVWEERAAAQLDRLGLRRVTSLELTPTEQRIADLVSQGLTNHDVAAALAVSVRTVESNLTRVYRKLGVERRAELVRLFTAAGTGRAR